MCPFGTLTRKITGKTRTRGQKMPVLRINLILGEFVDNLLRWKSIGLFSLATRTIHIVCVACMCFKKKNYCIV